MKRYHHKVEPLRRLLRTDRGMAPMEMSVLDKDIERREDGSASLQNTEVVRIFRNKKKRCCNADV